MLKVMIVDDSRIFRKMLKAAFVETGHEVIGNVKGAIHFPKASSSCSTTLA